uniref:Uncharacterized protein n=1 Tax=Erythrolobus australicus TaxID=1077150 RepID=A0A7S1TKH4_9RHOD|mmetsp:Transcript_2625/g.7135  ORF Transcript_2625/g.7135 Transcript_2625/m.7135 type:complete len:182 (+) Transcript_2625:103-648(+)
MRGMRRWRGEGVRSERAWERTVEGIWKERTSADMELWDELFAQASAGAAFSAHINELLSGAPAAGAGEIECGSESCISGRYLPEKKKKGSRRRREVKRKVYKVRRNSAARKLSKHCPLDWPEDVVSQCCDSDTPKIEGPGGASPRKVMEDSSCISARASIPPAKRAPALESMSIATIPSIV